MQFASHMFALQKSLINKVIGSLSAKTCRIAIIIYGRKSFVAIGLGKYESIASLQAAISMLQLPQPLAKHQNINGGLELAHSLLEGNKAMFQVIVLLTSQKLNHEATMTAQKISQGDKKLLIVGTGSAVTNHDLLAAAGKPYNAKILADESMMNDEMVDDLVQSVRPGIICLGDFLIILIYIIVVYYSVNSLVNILHI